MVPQIKVTGAQTAQGHRMALATGCRFATRMVGGLFGQGVARRYDKDFCLACRAGGHGTGNIFLGEILLGGLIGLSNTPGAIL